MKKIFLLIFTFFIALGVFVWFSSFTSLDASSKGIKTFEVVKGQGSSEIAYNLEQEKIIRWSPVFRLYVLMVGAAHRLKAGDYELSPSFSMYTIAKKMVQGDVIRERITVIEGWSVKDIAKNLEARGVITSNEFIENYLHLEGYLFPDTYDIPKEEPIEALVKDMQDNFEAKTKSLKPQLEQSKRTLEEIVIMASLLEKEVRTLEDKKTVSDILWRRLDAGIALQVDATIAYITGKKTTEITKKETQINSLYNTYKYRGLPKGPIGNPGLDSIVAVLEPQSNPYWYYLSKPTGETVFSRTLEEHNIAKATYLK